MCGRLTNIIKTIILQLKIYEFFKNFKKNKAKKKETWKLTSLAYYLYFFRNKE